MRYLFGMMAFLATTMLSVAGATQYDESDQLSSGKLLGSYDSAVIQAAYKGCCDKDNNDCCDSDDNCNCQSTNMSSCSSVIGRSCRNTDPCSGSWFDNLSAWGGKEAYKGIGDTVLPPGAGTGFMNSAGLVHGLGTSFRLGQSRIRGQVGGSIGVYDLKGRDSATPGQTEQQGFLTTGIFKRSDVDNCDRIAWGVVYDQFWGHQWGLTSSDLYLGQFRGIAGVAISNRNEVGFWGTAHTNTDSYAPSAANPTSRLLAVNQYNLYGRHTFDFGGSAMLYAGLVDRADFGDWTAGAQLNAPLSSRVSLYGNSAFLFPSAGKGAAGANELLWSISTGLSYSFGGKAVSRNISGQSGMPLLPVANNSTFMISTSAL